MSEINILIVGRIITAVFSPLSDAALILYLQEISPCSLRGTMSSLFSTGYAVMCLFGMLLGHEDVLVAVLILTLPFYPILQNSTFFFTHLNIPSPKIIILIFSSVAQFSSTLLMVLLTFACIASTCIVDKLPRRLMLLTAGTSCMLSLTAFVIAAESGYRYIAVAGVFVFVFSYGSDTPELKFLHMSIDVSRVGVGPVAWFISPELVPLQYRSAMFCMCYAVHSMLVVLTNFATVPLIGLYSTADAADVSSAEHILAYSANPKLSAIVSLAEA
ncbi:unnamed protein product [Strongylus vulgaris]|uniref:Major facilitator superfamily (MFS) profile domain-containing protein n=1 Tax=Strongylus vulgaris TaxID=40348 RepID=A0A3P7IWL9_STRVU|nr:unnamed protein product [Strongylus vulgaris]